jgi:hypothetical protein
MLTPHPPCFFSPPCVLGRFLTSLENGSSTDMFLDPIPGDFFQVRGQHMHMHTHTHMHTHPHCSRRPTASFALGGVVSSMMCPPPPHEWYSLLIRPLCALPCLALHLWRVCGVGAGRGEGT